MLDPFLEHKLRCIMIAEDMTDPTNLISYDHDLHGPKHYAICSHPECNYIDVVAPEEHFGFCERCDTNTMLNAPWLANFGWRPPTVEEMQAARA